MCKPIAIIPHYNHEMTLPDVVKQLLAQGLPVLVVDDGSNAESQDKIRYLTDWENVKLLFQSQNGGKGMAMKIGFQYAFAHGYTHALQVDADGQHQLSDVEKILQKMHENPKALICGNPIYGEDAPKARLYGRKITDFWNAIHTHSLEIKDGMCGFRLYPLSETVRLLNNAWIGNRMDFDIEILIKSHWQQIPLVWFDTPVRYAQDGISHFRGLADNWMISKMHTRLFFGMLARVLTRKPL